MGVHSAGERIDVADEMGCFSTVIGGLVARYAIGLLYSKGYFESIRPVVSCAPLAPFDRVTRIAH